jgi:cytochrome d ubiquinol oxidase subunit II
MEIFWFIALSLMIITYVILDGFDLGAGIIHLFAAKTEKERRTVLNAIGPVWDGNEVWLLAAGGVLFFAFPKVYASSFSGFYLPLMIVLWLLIGRAIGIELRKHVDNTLWKSFWDAVFSLSSLLLAIFFGAALGNVIRGVPLQSDGYFFEPLWTTFTIVPNAGILDWFTVLMGIVSLIVLTSHGANFIAMKTEGELQQRARKISGITNWVILITSILAIISVTAIKPETWNNYYAHPAGFVFPILGLFGLIGMIYFRIKPNDGKAFFSSSLFIFGMLGATANGLYPYLLPATTNPEYGLTVTNSKAGTFGLHTGMGWWVFGMALVFIYFIYVYKTFSGKVKLTEDTEGY